MALQGAKVNWPLSPRQKSAWMPGLRKPMKTGFNLLLWTTHVTEDHAAILRDIKRTGYDGIEIPIFEGSPDHYARLGALLDKLGLERTAVAVIAPGKNPLSPDKVERQMALDHAKWLIDCAAALGAPILG